MRRIVVILSLWLSVAATNSLHAQQPIEGVGIDENLGAALPLDAEFVDHDGKTVTLREYFADGRPVWLNLVYYGCPGLCTEILGGTAASIDALRLKLGEEYRVVTVSFDPMETRDLAAAKRENYLANLQNRNGQEEWVFLTGTQKNIDRLTQAVGFRYVFDEKSNPPFIHDAAAILVTGDGRISRYLRGTEYNETTLRLALVEASGGGIGSLSDQVWVRLCGYDASRGKYVLLAQTILKIGGAATILAVVAVVSFLVHLEHKKRKKGLQPHAA